MTATARISRVAVVLALGVTAPLVLRANAAQAAPVELATVGARLARPESAATAPAHRPHPVVADTSARRERGKSERPPAASLRRRVPRAKNGAAPSPQSTSGGSQYVPDQPWETEFFVQNTVPTRHFVVRLVSAIGN